MTAYPSGHGAVAEACAMSLSLKMRQAMAKLDRVRGWTDLDGRTGDALVRRGLAETRLSEFRTMDRVGGFGAPYVERVHTCTEYRRIQSQETS